MRGAALAFGLALAAVPAQAWVACMDGGFRCGSLCDPCGQQDGCQQQQGAACVITPQQENILCGSDYTQTMTYAKHWDGLINQTLYPNEQAVVAQLQALASAYQPTYPDKAQTLATLARDAADTITGPLQSVGDQVKAADACLSSAKKDSSGCYHGVNSDHTGCVDMATVQDRILADVKNMQQLLEALQYEDANLPLGLPTSGACAAKTAPVPCYNNMKGALDAIVALQAQMVALATQ